MRVRLITGGPREGPPSTFCTVGRGAGYAIPACRLLGVDLTKAAADLIAFANSLTASASVTHAQAQSAVIEPAKTIRRTDEYASPQRYFPRSVSCQSRQSNAGDGTRFRAAAASRPAELQRG